MTRSAVSDMMSSDADGVNGLSFESLDGCAALRGDDGGREARFERINQQLINCLLHQHHRRTSASCVHVRQSKFDTFATFTQTREVLDSACLVFMVVKRIDKNVTEV